MKNVPLTSEQVRKLGKGLWRTIVVPSRRMRNEQKRQNRIWQRKEERLYTQHVPPRWEWNIALEDWKLIPSKKIIHTSPIRNNWQA